jgi:type IV secretory pathway protease TraF
MANSGRKISVLSLFILGGMYSLSRYVYFNPSLSETRGYYFAYKASFYNIGDMVLVCLQGEAVAATLHQLGLPDNNGDCSHDYLLKHITAKAGDSVVVTNAGIKINNSMHLNSSGISRHKNIWLSPLPVGNQYVLESQEYFLLGSNANSYDSRYFGIVRSDSIPYKAVLFWPRNRPVWK